MTRVALLPSAYLPTLGGVQELTRNLALALVEAGDEVEIWTQQADGVGRSTVRSLDGLVVRRFPFPLPRAAVGALPALVPKSLSSLGDMRRAVRDFQPDVLHVQCFGPSGVYATALSYLTGVPLVLTLQGETVMDDHDVFDVSTTLRQSLRLALRRAAAVTACSQFTLDDAVHRFGLPAGRGEVIFNGVDLHLSATAAVPDLPDRYVLATGRVVDKKGFDLLLEAWPLVGKARDVQLAIAGSGPAEPALRGLAERLGVTENVRFLGRLSRQQVAAAMAGAEVFVMPSRLEPFGIVVLEAWRAGCPAVVTSHGGPREFVTAGVDGLVADPFDPADLSAKINRLLDDPTYRQRVGEAGRARVTDFGWPAIAARYRDAYVRALSRP